MTYLIQITGIGLYTGMIILAAIGDIKRFSSPRRLVGYSGLGARVHASGDSIHVGKISKRGRKELRWALVASAGWQFDFQTTGNKSTNAWQNGLVSKGDYCHCTKITGVNLVCFVEERT